MEGSLKWNQHSNRFWLDWCDSCLRRSEHCCSAGTFLLRSSSLHCFPPADIFSKIKQASRSRLPDGHQASSLTVSSNPVSVQELFIDSDMWVQKCSKYHGSDCLKEFHTQITYDHVVNNQVAEAFHVPSRCESSQAFHAMPWQAEGGRCWTLRAREPRSLPHFTVSHSYISYPSGNDCQFAMENGHL